MPFATGPWHEPPQLPEHPADLCLVLVEDPWRRRTHHAMRYARRDWWFEEGTALSATHRVVRWAYITDSVERMSQVPWTGDMPAESRLFVHRAITDHENVRLLTAYIGDLLARNQWLLKAVERAREVRGDPTDALRAEVNRLKGLLKHEQDVRAAQMDAHHRHRQSTGERITKLTAQVADLQRAVRDDATKALRAEVNRLKGLLKHEQDVRAAQAEAHQRHRERTGELIVKLTAEVAGLQRALLLAHTQRQDR